MSIIQEALKRQNSSKEPHGQPPPAQHIPEEGSKSKTTHVLLVIICVFVAGSIAISIYLLMTLRQQQGPVITEDSSVIGTPPEPIPTPTNRNIKSPTTHPDTVGPAAPENGEPVAVPPDSVTPSVAGREEADSSHFVAPAVGSSPASEQDASTSQGATNSSAAAATTENPPDAEDKDQWPSIKLTAIANAGNSPIVVLNGSVYEVGETIDGAKLIKVMPNAIELEFRGERKKIRMEN